VNPWGGVRWLFDSRHGLVDRLLPRWIFLRALALIYFSAFYSLLFQIKGLIGPRGILPAQEYLAVVADGVGQLCFWFAPSLYWISSSNAALMTVTWIGLIASIVAFLNLWPRVSLVICWICFLSFVAASSTFSSYQSDGMLLEAGFIALFFAPPGLRPGWGASHPPSRASLWLLQWEWFRIYFESGMVKLASGDLEWRNFTAMDDYYQNGPLPTWIGWYASHLPHWFHAFTVGATLALELGIVFMLFFPRRVRIICFFIVTPWEIGVILTANYTFLNYLVLALGFLLLDDKFLRPLIPARFRPATPEPKSETAPIEDFPLSIRTADEAPEGDLSNVEGAPGLASETRESTKPTRTGSAALHYLQNVWNIAGVTLAAVFLTWIAYDTTMEMLAIPLGSLPGSRLPIAALDPFRIANQYGLFAVMTRGRYEIEFQGSNDGQNWTEYPFRYKPQALNEAPRIYAPYQPRFDWNLWFASLSNWQENDQETNIVPLTEERLLDNSPDVLALFRGNPFGSTAPRYVRAVLWQYWFTSPEERRQSGNWWRRQFLGLYAPELARGEDGKFTAVQMPDELPPHE
jgi:lipase maturation factor 1